MPRLPLPSFAQADNKSATFVLTKKAISSIILSKLSVLIICWLVGKRRLQIDNEIFQKREQTLITLELSQYQQCLVLVSIPFGF